MPLFSDEQFLAEIFWGGSGVGSGERKMRKKKPFLAHIKPAVSG